MKTLVLASDLGGSGCKTVVVDMTDGRVVAHARSDYVTSRPNSGWAEQTPDDWFEALRTSVKRVMATPDVCAASIAGFAIVGVTHTAVLVGRDGRPVAPSILMFDSRSAPEAESIAARWGVEVKNLTLNEPTPVWTWPQLEWIRTHRPDVWERVDKIKFQKDFIRDRLVGQETCDHHFTDYIDAAGSLLFNPVESTWVAQFCDELGLDSGVLPAIAAPTDTAGELTPSVANDLGLIAGTPVMIGTTDTAAEMVGSGSVQPGQGILKLASVGRVAVVTDGPVVSDNVLNYRHVVDGLWYPGTASKYAASAYRWLRESFWPELDDATCYQVMDMAAASVPAGSDGLTFQPHLSGQWAPYWDPDLRAGFLGVSVHHGREHFTRAVLEGVAFSILDVLEDLETRHIVADDFRLIGQGAVSSLWAQIMADVTGRPLTVPSQVDAAYGGAMVAGIGAGLLSNTAESITNAVGTQGTQYMPIEANTNMFREMFDVYRATIAQQQELAAGLRHSN